jgi:hypothetical protein
MGDLSIVLNGSPPRESLGDSFPLGVLSRPALSDTEEKVAFCPLEGNADEVSAYVPAQ